MDFSKIAELKPEQECETSDSALAAGRAQSLGTPSSLFLVRRGPWLFDKIGTYTCLCRYP